MCARRIYALEVSGVDRVPAQRRHAPDPVAVIHDRHVSGHGRHDELIALCGRCVAMYQTCSGQGRGRSAPQVVPWPVTQAESFAGRIRNRVHGKRSR